jgi:hypothetical protein
VGAVMMEVVVDGDVGEVGCGRGEKVAPLSRLGCTNMTKWSVRSPNVYKPSLLLVIPRARPHFKYIS